MLVCWHYLLFIDLLLRAICARQNTPRGCQSFAGHHTHSFTHLLTFLLLFNRLLTTYTTYSLILTTYMDVFVCGLKPENLKETHTWRELHTHSNMRSESNCKALYKNTINNIKHKKSTLHPTLSLARILHMNPHPHYL